jgi:hypothetical protein
LAGALRSLCPPLTPATCPWVPLPSPALPHPCHATGQELADDALTVGDIDLRNARHVVTVQLSPVDNTYTTAPEEYRPVWESCSPEWLMSRQVGGRGGVRRRSLVHAPGRA